MQTIKTERVAVKGVGPSQRKTIMVSPLVHRMLKELWLRVGVRRMEDLLLLLLIAVELQAEREKREVHEYLREIIRQVILREG